MKHYLVYKITNLINNKIYIGKHITEKINDDYYGSSHTLSRDIRSYGVDKFKKEILYDFNNEVDMDNMEASIVDWNFILRGDVYNKSPGGKGNWSLNAGIRGNNSHLRKLKEDVGYYKRFCSSVSKGVRRSHVGGKLGKKISESLKLGYLTKRLKPVVLSKEHYEKVGKINSIRQKGSGNSHYRTKWIYNLELKKSVPIKIDRVQEYLDKGWKLGRKIIWKR